MEIRMSKPRIFQKVALFLLAVLIRVSAGEVFAAEEPLPAKDLLLDTYQSNTARLETNSFGIPLFLDSYEKDDRVQVDVYGILNHPFNSIARELKVPANWCDIVTLPPNVKACTYGETARTGTLTFYLGRKVYQAPEDTRQIRYRFRNIEQQHGYLEDMLTADEGPYGTRDHKMRFEALSLDKGRTFVHVSYSYSDSAALRLAAKIYFATLGRDKVGFTVTGLDSDGNPDYIGGPRGAVERNAVRYYFAIQSFMDTLRIPEESRFTKRIIEWYDLTSRYRKQLYDLDRKDYLTFKAAEHKDQVELQRRIDEGCK
jgi:hypothetical protein